MPHKYILIICDAFVGSGSSTFPLRFREKRREKRAAVTDSPHSKNKHTKDSRSKLIYLCARLVQEARIPCRGRRGKAFHALACRLSFHGRGKEAVHRQTYRSICQQPSPHSTPKTIICISSTKPTEINYRAQASKQAGHGTTAAASALHNVTHV